jgi:hypothetical protein
MPIKRRECQKCGKNRALKFYTPQGRICATCRKATTRKNARGTHLATTYGISHDEYESILHQQSESCAICGGVRKGSYDVDHDHKLEKRLIVEGFDPLEARRQSIRGLLCKRCNRRLLPATLDDTRILQRAIDYLMNPPARRIIKRQDF